MRIFPQKLDRKSLYIQSSEDTDHIRKNIEDGKYTDFLFTCLKFQQIILFLIEINIFLLSLCYIEIGYSRVTSQDMKELLLYLILVLTILKVITIFLKHSADFAFQKGKNYIKAETKYFSSNMPKKLLVEFVFALFIPMNGFEYDMAGFTFQNKQRELSFTYSLNECLVFFSFCRLIFSLRYLDKIFTFGNNSSKRICLIYSANNNFKFTLKCLLETYQIRSIVFLLFFTIFAFAYFIRICEFENPIFEFSNYYNCCWFTVVTMTTTGYGDYQPLSPPGRVVAFLLGIWGMIQSNLIAVVLINKIKFKDNEARVLKFFQNSFSKHQIEKQTIRVLIIIYKLKKILPLPENLFSRLVINYYMRDLHKHYRILMDLTKCVDNDKTDQESRYKKWLEKQAIMSSFNDKSYASTYQLIAQIDRLIKSKNQ